MKNMTFKESLMADEKKLRELSQRVVEMAVKAGADECEVSVGGARGLSVSSRDGEVENIEFNRDNGMEITVFKNHCRGNSSTSDLNLSAIEDCVNSAISIASYADEDDCAGICDKDLQCTQFLDLELCHEPLGDPDVAVKQACMLDKKALCETGNGIKGSDGASFDSYVYNNAFANSNGFSAVKSSSSSYLSLTLIGEASGRMQRGSGYSINRDYTKLDSPENILNEAKRETLDKLNRRPVKTGKYNIIFRRGAAVSLWGNLISAISGGAVYRKSSFLCEALGKRILPEFLTIHENPFIKGGLGSANFDSEGVRTAESDIVANGVLKQYLLSSYSSRKLKLKSNGHAGGIYNWFIGTDTEHARDFDELLKEVGEGLVITSLMGQGVDLVSGNYSRGATGFYFKNGERVHAVEEITVAGNLGDIFGNIALIGTDVDERYKIKTGSILVPQMTVSGS